MPAAALSDESRAVVRRFFAELWNNGNLNVADELNWDTLSLMRQISEPKLAD